MHGPSPQTRENPVPYKITIELSFNKKPTVFCVLLVIVIFPLEYSRVILYYYLIN